MKIITPKIWESISHIIPQDAEKNNIIYSNKEILETLVWQVKTGCQWRQLPDSMPSKSLVLAKRKEWLATGIFNKLLDKVLNPLEETVLVDATFIEVKVPLPERGLTKVGDGLKLQCLVGLSGDIQALQLSSANTHESVLFKEFMDYLSEESTLPKLIIADSAYASTELLAYAKSLNSEILPTAYYGSSKKEITVRMKKAKKIRWTIERSFAWLKSWKGIETCRARSLEVYLASLSLAIAKINSS